MSEYGVTPTGFVKKRLDVIIKEIQTELTEELGFDVSLNPESFLNVLITTYADRIAQLWECAEQVYFSQYPSSAEGANLDNAAQFGGITRNLDERTRYTILCTGSDGTALPLGTRIASKTSPTVYFSLFNDFEITRHSFNKATVQVVTAVDGTSYIVTINGNSYTALSGVGATEESIVSALKDAITEDGFTVTANGKELSIVCDSAVKSNDLELSSNLTTGRVSSLAIFQSDEYGKVVLPEGSITEIVTTIVGFDSCYNLPSPAYGRLMETDTEFRQSYIKKIASRSSMMLESITSAILEEVEGAESATGYENDGNVTDAEGRPPHTIEIVVDGGDDADIAAQILKKKAAGIGTHGSVSVDVPDVFGGTIPVRFNRPQSVNVWMKVTITKNPQQAMPPNYVSLVREAVWEFWTGVKAGESVMMQDIYPYIKEKCTGIGYIDIAAYATTDSGSEPSEEDYTLKNVYVSSRQKAVITQDSDRIEVVLNGS